MDNKTHVTADWRDTAGMSWQDVSMNFYIKGVNRQMNCGIISPVVGNLYQGGCSQDVVLGSDFDTVVSLYPWERYDIADNVVRHEFTMYDSSDGVLEEDLFAASDAVLSALETGTVLVHCQAGINRSGLVTAFTLMRQGVSAQEAIDLLRRQRDPLVLSNKTFVKQLHDLEQRRGEWE